MITAKNHTIRGFVATEVYSDTANTGDRYARFRVAVPTRQKNTEGQWEDGAADWVTCTAWGSLAEKVSQFIHKGMGVMVTGELSFSAYATKEGLPTAEAKLTITDVGQSLRLTKTDAS